MSWVCSNGHTNDDSRGSCYVLTCTSTKPAEGTNAAGWFSWLVAVFAGPIYPVSGLLAWAAMAVVSYGGQALGWGDGGWKLAMPVAALVVFWQTLPLEQRAGRSASYRRFRTIFRVVALIAGIGWLISHMDEYGLSPAAMTGLMVAGPFVFFLLWQMDRVLDVGVSERTWNLPLWLEAFLEKSNWRSAVVLGFGGGVLGFALGREAGILAGLGLWIVTTFVIMLFSGASALLEHGRAVGTVLLGAFVGGMVGSLFSVVGMLIGAAGGGYLAGRRGGLSLKKRRSVYD